MAQTFINYGKNKGFEINEAFMEILSNFICQTFENRGFGSKPQWYTDMYEDFDLCSKGVYQNWMSFVFEDYLNNDVSRENELINILEETKTLISSEGEKIGLAELQKLEDRKISEDSKNKWNIPIQTSDLISVLDILIKILRYEWKSDNYKVTFEGFSSKTTEPNV